MNSNPQVKKLCDEDIRPFCDLLAGVAIRANILLLRWAAEGFDPLVPRNEDAIDDGADKDGRTVLTNGDIRRVIEVCGDIKLLSDGTTPVTGSAAKFASIVRASVNPR